ncbi:hypothetical protein ACGFMM_32625 [Streptomyces sp. NPDC048604]|uniref:hypothetical protein n=1 Tax=Streptomyces sp. NPDC048604 TaxID=3365578 RepID=UPI0037166ED0
MKRSFKAQAGLQLALATVALLAAAYSPVPHLPPFASEGILLGVGFALLFPLHAATIFRSISLESRARGFASSKSNQWRALKALPGRVHALLVALALSGAVLVTGAFSRDLRPHRGRRRRHDPRLREAGRLGGPAVTPDPRHGKPYAKTRLRIRAVLIGLAGSAALVAGTLLFTRLPHAVAEERAFRAASACRGTVTGDCQRAAWFTVDSVRVHRGKSPGGWVEVSGSDEAAGEVRLSGVSAFLDQVSPGDRVAGTIWRGEIIALWEGESGQRTYAYPEGAAQGSAGGGIILLLGGIRGVHVSQWYLRHHEAAAHRRRPHPLARSGWAVAGLSGWTLLLLLILDGWDPAIETFTAIWAPTSLAAVTLLVHRGRRGGGSQ